MKVLTMQLNSIIVMDIIALRRCGAGIGIAARELAVGHVSLSGALCILLLSADFFLPMRALGYPYFHVAMNGMAASDKIFKLLDLPRKPPARPPSRMPIVPSTAVTCTLAMLPKKRRCTA